MSLIFEHKEVHTFIQGVPNPLKTKLPIPTKRKKVIVIAGPTAVGKTACSLKIAEVIGGEIVSADSIQVYKGLDIGTAKVTKEERAKVPHHLIDIRNLSETFNVKDFHTEAYNAIHDIIAKEHVPLVVGGTGFYLHAFLYGPPSGPPSVPLLRDQLETEMEEKGPEFMYEKLQALDPLYAKTITQGDRHKIIRALEIMSLTSQKVSEFSKDSNEPPEHYDFRCWFLYMPKENLYPKIEMRCDKMIAEGLIDEVRRLEQEGLRENTSASQAIGYRQCLDYLASAQTPQDFEHFVQEFKTASKRYAKRQFTWFKKEPLFRWINVEEYGREKVIEMIIQDFEVSF